MGGARPWTRWSGCGERDEEPSALDTPRSANDPSPAMTSPSDHVVKRCATCGRFRAYEADDDFCLLCGGDELETTCGCGRAYDYALAEDGGDLHCPRCGKRLRGRSSEFDR